MAAVAVSHAKQVEAVRAKTVGAAHAPIAPTRPISGDAPGGRVFTFSPRCDRTALAETLAGVEPSQLARWTGLCRKQCARILAGERGLGVDMLARLPVARREAYGRAVASGHQLSLFGGK